MQETSRIENQKLFEASRTENRKPQPIMEKNKDRRQKFLSKIERKLEPTTEKLQEIRESLRQRITIAEEKASDLEKTIDGKLIMIEEKINNLQRQLTKPVQVVSEGIGRMNPPWFDGSSPLSVFEFKTVAGRNG